MGNRLLIIDEQAKKKIQAVVKYAEEHPFKLEDLVNIMEGAKPAAGNDPQFRCELERGYRIVFTIEDHPGGKFRHISLSVDEAGHLPSVGATAMIMNEFGFKTEPGECSMYLEDLLDDITAINLLEQID